ncbi:hypothetical protein [Mycoplasma sp. E35C]|uniref:hypothetical protein n=1 Tax=Mycoplasma sp. E35C TaxID=2801918 RepID=UPI001CA4514B|nr:hypothetical protein [Mycoplasma sp. E35C]QZX49051.1 hypothetical protein JJE79_03270 [Mycoplasma sp. E35C]
MSQFKKQKKANLIVIFFILACVSIFFGILGLGIVSRTLRQVANNPDIELSGTAVFLLILGIAGTLFGLIFLISAISLSIIKNNNKKALLEEMEKELIKETQRNENIKLIASSSNSNNKVEENNQKVEVDKIDQNKPMINQPVVNNAQQPVVRLQPANMLNQNLQPTYVAANNNYPNNTTIKPQQPRVMQKPVQVANVVQPRNVPTINRPVIQNQPRMMPSNGFVSANQQAMPQKVAPVINNNQPNNRAAYPANNQSVYSVRAQSTKIKL